MRYIKGTVDVGLVFEKDVGGKQECTGYVDFYYAGDLDKCRSNYRECLYLVAGTGELALHFIVYRGSDDDRSRVHGSDRCCK